MHYILIHGFAHTADCWATLSLRLLDQGHTVEALELPIDQQEQGDLINYDACYGAVKAALEQRPRSRVIAHSMAGLFASALLESEPCLIEHLFLIAAWLPQIGVSMLEMASRYEGAALPFFLSGYQPVEGDKFADLSPEERVEDQLALAKRVLYHDCSPEIRHLAGDKLTLKPLLFARDPLLIQLSDATAHKRTYILCHLDRALTLAKQRELVKLFRSEIIEIQAGHAPFLSQPDLLAQLILAR